MSSSALVRYLPDAPEYDSAVARLADDTFGPGRFARAAERVREMAPHARGLSFVACADSTVLGVVRQTPVRVGAYPALLLGPLLVRPAHKGVGIGRALMRLAAEAAGAGGERAIVLVGDRSYYLPLGYRPVSTGAIVFPGPVDPQRILCLPLDGNEPPVELRGTIAPR